MKKTILLATLALTLGACAATEEKGPAADEMIAAAEQEIATAKKAGAELWVNTESLLADAKEQQKAGDNAAAGKSAKKALHEAKLALKQTQDNAKAGPRYPSY
jgi:hypothetical protein